MGAQNSKVLRLHILSGSFVEVDAGGGRPMDASVWSRLPDDMLWRVLGFVPAAKLFQLHTVSRKWRQVLTSRRFRDTIAAAAAKEDPETRWRRHGEVVAWVSAGDEVEAAGVVDVHLTPFVPSSFWTRHEDGCTHAAPAAFFVMAAGNDLVCIRNHLQCKCDAHADTRYCVLNPLTRTCVVLPPAPFPSPPEWKLDPQGCILPYESEVAAAAPALTVCKWEGKGTRWKKLLKAATCDLQAVDGDGDGGGPRWITLHKSAIPVAMEALHPRFRPPLAQCGGETFVYHVGRLHVPAAPAAAETETAAAETGTGTRAKRSRLEGGAAAAAVYADPLDGPSVALLGLDAATIGYKNEEVFLVAQRGAIFLVAPLKRLPDRGGWQYTDHPELVAGVWRLDRGRRAWEPVSRLDVPQVRRLLESAPVKQTSEDVLLRGVWMVRNLLCCEFALFDGRSTDMSRRFPGFVLGFNHVAGEWQVVLDDQALLARRDECHLLHPAARLLHLRPDLFLS